MQTMLFLHRGRLLGALLPWLWWSPLRAQSPATLTFDQVVGCGSVLISQYGPVGVGPGLVVPGLQGHTYVAGQYGGTARFGPLALTAPVPRANPDLAHDQFVAKLDAQGRYIWAASTADTTSILFTSLSTDAAGDVYVAGSFADFSARFGTQGIVLYNSSAHYEGFVAKLDGATGRWLWARRFGGVRDDQGHVAVDPTSGAVYVGGWFQSAIADFGPLTLTNSSTSAPTADLFVARISPAGTWQWARRDGGVGDERINRLVADGQGGLFALGAFRGGQQYSVVLGPTTLLAQGVPNSYTANAAGDLFVARLDAQGNWLWVVQGDAVQGRNYVRAHSLALDGSRRLYVTGSYGGSGLRLGPHVLPNRSRMIPPPTPLPTPQVNYYEDGFLAQLDAADGRWRWAVRYGGDYDDSYASVATDQQRRLYVTAGLRNADWSETGYVAQVDSTNGVWLAQSLLPAQVYFSTLGASGTGRVLLGGVFTGPSQMFGPYTLPAAGPNLATGYLARVGGAVLPARAPAVLRTELQVWPNPSRGGVWVQAPAPGRAVEVLDALGRRVAAGALPPDGRALFMELPASLARGLYIVRCEGQSRRLVLE